MWELIERRQKSLIIKSFYVVDAHIYILISSFRIKYSMEK